MLKIPMWKLILGIERDIDVKEELCARNPRDVATVARELIGNAAEEYLYVFCVNTKLHVVGVSEVAHGMIAHCSFSPADVLKRALLCNAYGIIIAHNHPSGDCTPSADDIDVAKRLASTATLLGIKLLDSIIVTHDDQYYSMQEYNLF
jgi:DNA repair protein RadC